MRIGVKIKGPLMNKQVPRNKRIDLFGFWQAPLLTTTITTIVKSAFVSKLVSLTHTINCQGLVTSYSAYILVSLQHTNDHTIFFIILYKNEFYYFKCFGDSFDAKTK
ncbi:hypothetical protein HanRHA438_Chr11g0511301 [Helianthus annuus]|nr:hypothetical protein HanRHA438_Chr11g0511301 [Helianthus annuus]